MAASLSDYTVIVAQPPTIDVACLAEWLRGVSGKARACAHVREDVDVDAAHRSTSSSMESRAPGQ